MVKKPISILFMIAWMFISLAASSQSWLKAIPPDVEGRPDYQETKKHLETFRTQNPESLMKGEKQFLRSQFFLDGRIGDDGYLPMGTYWEEGKKVIASRSLYKAMQTPWVYRGPFNSTTGINSGEVGGS